MNFIHSYTLNPFPFPFRKLHFRLPALFYNSKFISGSLFWTFKAFISIEVYNLYNISYNITNFEFIIGPKYVLLYGVLLSGIIGLIRQFSSIQSLGTSIIKLCATQEQQERCLGSLSIDSNSLKQKTE